MVRITKALPTMALITLCASPAAAQNGGVVLWDLHLAGNMNELLVSDDSCREGPYRLYRQTCVGNELNISLERGGEHDETWLDRVVVFVHRYKDLNLDRDLSPATRFKVKAKLSNIYQQEAEVRVTLRVQF